MPEGGSFIIMKIVKLLILFFLILFAGIISQLSAKENNTDFTLYYLPVINRLDMQIPVESSIPASAKTSISVKLLSKGKKIFFGQASGNVLEPVSGKYREFIVDVPVLTPGTYQTVITITNPNRKPVTVRREFTVEKWDWLDNKLGISKNIVPPFTPIKVDGNAIEVLDRKYYLDEIGLPERIIAKNKDILSYSVSLHALHNGNTVKITNRKYTINEQNNNILKISGSGNIGNIDLGLKTTLEYDGFLTVRLILDPKKPEKLDRLTLTIPVKSEIARLMHCVGARLRTNYAGNIPEGTGRIWDSTQSCRDNINNTFIPYLWVGGKQRGICWMADWSKGWSLEPWNVNWLKTGRNPAIELCRNGNSVIIKIHFINYPVTIDRKREIVFGLMATPVKPFPENWQRWSFRGMGPPFERFYVTPYTNMWGGKDRWGEVYPRQWDYSLLREILKYKNSGKIQWRNVFKNKQIQEFVKVWRKKHKLDDKCVLDSQRSLCAGFIQASNSKCFVTYINTRALSAELPEAKYFGPEWYIRPHRFNSTVPVRSFQDLALWSFAKMIDAGIDGIYFDNTFPASNMNWAANQAYIDEFGKVQPNCGLFAIRNFIKRTRLLFHSNGIKQPKLIVHMTNTLVIPCFSFATIQYDWEWHRGTKPHPERFSNDFIRAESTGLQAGLVPFVMERIGRLKDKAGMSKTQRSFWAVTLPHAIKDSRGGITDFVEQKRPDKVFAKFAAWDKNCKFMPYWELELEPNPAFKITAGEKVVLSYYQKPEKVLLICSNLNSKSQNIKISVNPEILKLGNKPITSDPCDNKKVIWNKNTLKLLIHGYDYRMILLEKK